MASTALGKIRRASHDWDRTRVANIFLQFGLIWAFVLLLIASAIAYPGLLRFANIRNLISQGAPVGVKPGKKTVHALVLKPRGVAWQVQSC